MLVDAMTSYEVLSFMDAFLVYHQIPLSKEDQKKMAFIINTSLLCYNVMLFGLKNIGVLITYHQNLSGTHRDNHGGLCR